ncbi:MAG: MerR family DNA-binding transcriptional regulator [Pseudomonadota bacterium]
MPELDMAAIASNLDHLIDVAGTGEQNSYRIGDLAKEFSLTLRTLRFYEDRGLINPERRGSTRIYSQHDHSRLKVIVLAKQVGFALTEIQQIMDIYDNPGKYSDPVNAMLEMFKSQMSVLAEERSETELAIAKLTKTIDMLRTLSRE